MKYKYAYNKKNGMIYRRQQGLTDADDKAEVMSHFTGNWDNAAFTALSNKDFCSPISPSVVHYFESQGGYRPDFRSATID